MAPETLKAIRAIVKTYEDWLDETGVGVDDRLSGAGEGRRKIRKDVAEFLREKIIQNLRLCDDAQIKLFKKMYGPVLDIPNHKIEAALDVVERTNKKRGRWIEGEK